MINSGFQISSTRAISSSHNDKQFYFMPHPLLRNYVSHYTFSYSTAEHKQSVKSPAEELVLIPAGGGCLILGCNSKDSFESCWGPTSKPVKVLKGDSTKDEKMFFIEFMPGGLFAFTGIPQKELRDIQAPLCEIERALTKELRNAVMISQSIEELISRTDNILIKALDSKCAMQPSVMSVLKRINETGGQLPIRRLAEYEYISERHLNRLFEKSIGMSVKIFERLVRINRAVNLYKSNTSLSVTFIAQETGFFDESHFIRDFNEFCGTTPNVFIKNMSDFYNEPFKL